MLMAERRRLWAAAPLAFLVALSGCDTPLASEAVPVDPDALAAASQHAQAGIPISATAVARVVAIEACAADPDAPRLTLQGSSRAPGLGPYQLEYSYCVREVGVTDLAVVLRTPAGELRMVALEEPGTVIPSDHPDYDVEAHAVWRITEGTGKFRRAGGDLQADLFAVTTPSLAITTILTGTIRMGAS